MPKGWYLKQKNERGDYFLYKSKKSKRVITINGISDAYGKIFSWEVAVSDEEGYMPSSIGTNKNKKDLALKWANDWMKSHPNG